MSPPFTIDSLVQLLHRPLRTSALAGAAFLMLGSANGPCQTVTYPIVGTGVQAFYGDSTLLSQAPAAGQTFYGQDATYYQTYRRPSYTDLGNGVIRDNVTGLDWQQEMGAKISWQDAFSRADSLNAISFGGFNDWRVPTIKELYSLILFTGRCNGTVSILKYIDTTYFRHPLGDITAGEREIDAQTWSATQYVGLTMGGDTTVFGVNFLDGRIKGYPKYDPKQKNRAQTMYFRLVRGALAYGRNRFVDNGDGTVTDSATGLMWQQADDGIGRDWKNALDYAESLSLAGHTDWRLPCAKELQSIVDYARCPDVTHSPSIDTSFFNTSQIADPDGHLNYPYFWTGTTHLDGQNPYTAAVYVAFGEAQGRMNNNLMDVHGAGAQRSDPKAGDSASYPVFWGPQGDVRYVYNYVRCVRDAAGWTEARKVLPGRLERLSSRLTYIAGSRTLSFTLGHATTVTLRIYDTKGAVIATLAQGYLGAGEYVRRLPQAFRASGVFVAVLQTGTADFRHSFVYP